MSVNDNILYHACIGCIFGHLKFNNNTAEMNRFRLLVVT